jgi:predicted nucleotide-binding protein (sugar kinase/HSP70/actin superfamily)
MRFFKQKQTVTVGTGGNPASRKLADATVQKLISSGMTLQAAAKCMGEMGKATNKYFHRMQPYAQKAQPFDHLLKEWTDDLKTILTAAGITEVAKQEETILEYLDIIEASC